jgi:hypothetical protein
MIKPTQITLTKTALKSPHSRFPSGGGGGNLICNYFGLNASQTAFTGVFFRQVCRLENWNFLPTIYFSAQGDSFLRFLFNFFKKGDKMKYLSEIYETGRFCPSGIAPNGRKCKTMRAGMSFALSKEFDHLKKENVL